MSLRKVPPIVRLKHCKGPYTINCDLVYEETCGIWSACQRSGHEIVLYLPPEPVQDSSGPTIALLSSPWRFNRTTTFMCKTTNATLTPKAELDDHNNYVFPDCISKAIQQGRVRGGHLLSTLLCNMWLTFSQRLNRLFPCTIMRCT